jgi:hypothetical protein
MRSAHMDGGLHRPSMRRFSRYAAPSAQTLSCRKAGKAIYNHASKRY